MRARLQLESLETRDLPALLVNPTLIRFQDIDGDWAEVKLSRPLFTAENVNTIFHFSVGDVDGNTSVRQQLNAVDLTSLGTTPGFVDLTITTSRSRRTPGNGRVDVGGIYYPYADEGNPLHVRDLTVMGDLGYLRIGNGQSTDLSLRTLKVFSLGLNPTSQGGYFDNNLEGLQVALIELNGNVGNLIVEREVRNIEVRQAIFFTSSVASINHVSIGGSVVNSQLGFVHARSIWVGGSLIAQSNSPDNFVVTSIVGSRIEKATIGGSIVARGLADARSAAVELHYVEQLTVGGPVRAEANQGVARISISASSAIFRQSITGGVGGLSWAENTGIELRLGAIVNQETWEPNDTRYGKLVVHGNVEASIIVLKNTSQIEITGSQYSSGVRRGAFLYVSPAAHLQHYRVGRHLRSNFIEDDSFPIQADGRLDTLTVGGDFRVTALFDEFYPIFSTLLTQHPINIHVGGSLANLHIDVGAIGSMKVGGNYQDCYTVSHGEMGRISIGGNFTSSAANRQSFGINSAGSVSSITIGGDLSIGQDSFYFAGIQVGNAPPGEIIPTAHLGSLSIGGNFSAAQRVTPLDDVNNPFAGLFVSGTLDTIRIGRDLNNVRFIVTGMTGQDAIRQFTIGGNVIESVLSTGRALFADFDNRGEHSGIGTMHVRGAWVASVLSAGIYPGLDYRFFTEDDVRVQDVDTTSLAIIRSLRIDGPMVVNPNLDRNYGITADWIQSLHINGQSIALTLGALNDLILLDVLGQLLVKETYVLLSSSH
jgi:hypothetical protein